MAKRNWVQGSALLRDFQRLLEIGLDVLDGFDTDREPDEVGSHAGRELFFHCELLVRCRGRMNDEAFRIADIRQIREQLERVDEFFARFLIALDAETDDAAETSLEIFRGDGVARGYRAVRGN